MPLLRVLSVILILGWVETPAGIISTMAGTPTTQGYSGDGGPATSARLADPHAIALDGAGSLFIADYLNHRIRKVDTSGFISTVAGNGTGTFGGDGGLATNANLNLPRGVAVDSLGNVFIADRNNLRVRKVDATTGIITTVAGTGSVGCGGINISALSADLSLPVGVTVDGAGGFFIVDGSCSMVFRVDSSGSLTPVAGNGTSGFGGDGGPATAAMINLPESVALDASGNLFIGDRLNHRVRKVDATTGIITTVAGNGTSGFSGDGGLAASAQLNQPIGVALDSAGNLYIADTNNNRIRVVDTSGTIFTLAGSATSGFCGDGGPATSACLSGPLDVAVNPSGGVLLFSEVTNDIIRRVDSPTVTFQSSQYCISGTSSGEKYSWWIDIADDNANQSTEPATTNAGPVLPVGSSATDLAADFANSLNNDPKCFTLGISALATGNCFVISTPAKLCAGGSNPGAPCSVNADCPGGGACVPFVYSLRVGLANLPPTCKVTAVGCAYNPVITLGHGAPAPSIPTLGGGGMALLALMLVGAGAVLLLRGFRTAQGRP